MQLKGNRSPVSRRKFIQGCAAATALASTSVMEGWGAMHGAARQTGPAYRSFNLDRDWKFGGKLSPKALDPAFDDTDFSTVTLPHCVAPLSWQNWNPDDWQAVWAYRRHFKSPSNREGLRFFLNFERVMAGTTPVLNGNMLPKHTGGYLPFEYEVTQLLQDGNNVLGVAVDGCWLNAPPSGSPRGPASIDYLLPAGINGSVSLQAVPLTFLQNVFARCSNALAADRELKVTCTVNSDASTHKSARIVAHLRHAGRTIATQSRRTVLKSPMQQVTLLMRNLGDIVLWDVDNPHLYEVLVTLFVDEEPVHNYRTRIGFREARFGVDGFFLNGNRLNIFGLDRHELYPYIGYAAPKRLLRKDAEILRRDFHCNMVRCSHYPQSEAFLDACDELGLMVWEELPGWQYIGDENWQKLALRDVSAMIHRDRNHPSIIIWGVRINESRNDPALYLCTKKLAKSLDETRPTSGTMTSGSEKLWRTEWHQDVFAFDDYHAASPGVVGIAPPLPGVPYLITEAVGQFNYNTGKGFTNYYRRAGNAQVQQQQAIFHAQAHSKSAGYQRCAGLIAWCAFEYASLLGDYQAVKYPGISDVFRIPKLGASFYRSQGDPTIEPVILPSFYWDFSLHTPSGPGPNAAIFSNCERLELFIDDKYHSTIHPDRTSYPHLQHAPFFADLQLNGAQSPELRVEGYRANKMAISRSFSSNHSEDRLFVHADDTVLEADSSDATRLMFAQVDKFGAPRPFVGGEVSIHVEGPGVVIGDNPFDLGKTGGAGAVYIRTIPHRAGRIRITVHHAALGTKIVHIRAKRPAEQSEEAL